MVKTTFYKDTWSPIFSSLSDLNTDKIYLDDLMEMILDQFEIMHKEEVEDLQNAFKLIIQSDGNARDRAKLNESVITFRSAYQVVDELYPRVISESHVRYIPCISFSLSFKLLYTYLLIPFLSILASFSYYATVLLATQVEEKIHEMEII